MGSWLDTAVAGQADVFNMRSLSTRSFLLLVAAVLALSGCSKADLSVKDRAFQEIRKDPMSSYEPAGGTLKLEAEEHFFAGGSVQGKERFGLNRFFIFEDQNAVETGLAALIKEAESNGWTITNKSPDGRITSLGHGKAPEEQVKYGRFLSFATIRAPQPPAGVVSSSLDSRPQIIVTLTQY